MHPSPIKNEKIHPGVIYDTSLENTLNIMKNNIGFFIQKKEIMVLLFGMDFQLKKKRGKKIKIN